MMSDDPVLEGYEVSGATYKFKNARGHTGFLHWEYCLRVIEVLDNQSGPGSLHENTLLVVMGDHGQTLNGDHGGGSSEEVVTTPMVETAIFAMSFKKPLSAKGGKLPVRLNRINISIYISMDGFVSIFHAVGSIYIELEKRNDSTHPTVDIL